MSYTLDSIDAVNAAIANYSLTNSDPKSELLVSYGLISVGVSLFFLVFPISMYLDTMRLYTGRSLTLFFS